MARKSRYLKEAKHVKLTDALADFEDWLHDQGYVTTTKDYPYGVQVDVLVDEFLEEASEHDKERKALRKHAAQIGYVTDHDPADLALNEGEEPPDDEE